MHRIIAIFMVIFFVPSCSQQHNSTPLQTEQSKTKKISKFYYSKSFAKRFDIKAGDLIPEWDGLIAIALESEGHRPDSCYAKVYLGNDIDFDYPAPENFINITGERHKELFSFTPYVNDEDARMQGEIILRSANKIAARGYVGDKITASTGFNIDYVLRDAAKDITVIKTDSALCDVLMNKEYKYYMLLKPKGINKSGNYLKYYLPINK